MAHKTCIADSNALRVLRITNCSRNYTGTLPPTSVLFHKTYVQQREWRTRASGRSGVQADSHRPLTSEVQLRFHTRPRQISGAE